MEEGRVGDGLGGRVEVEVVEHGNLGDIAVELEEEERLLGEGNGDSWEAGEGTISKEEEAVLLGEEVSVRGSAEGAVGGEDSKVGTSQGAGKVQITLGKGNTQGEDTDNAFDKTDQNNNDQGLGHRLRPMSRAHMSRAHRRPFGRIIGRGGKMKFD